MWKIIIVFIILIAIVVIISLAVPGDTIVNLTPAYVFDELKLKIESDLIFSRTVDIKKLRKENSFYLVVLGTNSQKSYLENKLTLGGTYKCKRFTGSLSELNSGDLLVYKNEFGNYYIREAEYWVDNDHIDIFNPDGKTIQHLSSELIVGKLVL